MSIKLDSRYNPLDRIQNDTSEGLNYILIHLTKCQFMPNVEFKKQLEDISYKKDT